MDPRTPIFWIVLAVSEVVFGVAIFAATRQYYLSQNARASAAPVAAAVPAAAWPNPAIGADLGSTAQNAAPAERFGTALPATSDDPATIARQADEFFAKKDYERAAALYARLLALAPDDAEVYNNLGLTLQYLGRSEEALEQLAKGVQVNPTHQRIWLTTGFVYAQTGQVDDARLALNNAVMIDPDSDVGRSAAEMLTQLPQ